MSNTQSNRKKCCSIFTKRHPRSKLPRQNFSARRASLALCAHFLMIPFCARDLGSDYVGISAPHSFFSLLFCGRLCGNSSSGGAQLRPLLSTEACRRAGETRSGPRGQNKGSCERPQKIKNKLATAPPSFSRHLRLIEINCRGAPLIFSSMICATPAQWQRALSARRVMESRKKTRRRNR